MKCCFTVLMLVLIICGNAQTPTNSNAYINANYQPASHTDGITPGRLNNLKGNIRQLSVFEYTSNKDLSAGDMTPGAATFSLLFDTGKRIKQEWSYLGTKQAAGKIFFRSYKNYSVDSAINYNSTGKIVSGEWYTYNSDGLIIKEKDLNNGAVKQLQFTVEKKGDTILHHASGGVNKYFSKKLVEQSQQDGSLVTRYTYAQGGTIRRKTYYEKGRIMRIEDFNTAGYLVFIQYNRFNNSGVVTEKNGRFITYNQDGTEAEETSVHITQAGTMRETTNYVYQLGKLAQMKEGKVIAATYKYNDKGDLVEESSPDGKDTYAYPLYDAKDNWLKKISYHNNQAITVTERQIEYYP